MERWVPGSTIGLTWLGVYLLLAIRMHGKLTTVNGVHHVEPCIHRSSACQSVSTNQIRNSAIQFEASSLNGLCRSCVGSPWSAPVPLQWYSRMTSTWHLPWNLWLTWSLLWILQWRISTEFSSESLYRHLLVNEDQESYPIMLKNKRESPLGSFRRIWDLLAI